jgi:hypothetical protein
MKRPDSELAEVVGMLAAIGVGVAAIIGALGLVAFGLSRLPW